MDRVHFVATKSHSDKHGLGDNRLTSQQIWCSDEGLSNRYCIHVMDARIAQKCKSDKMCLFIAIVNLDSNTWQRLQTKFNSKGDKGNIKSDHIMCSLISYRGTRILQRHLSSKL